MLTSRATPTFALLAAALSGVFVAVQGTFNGKLAATGAGAILAGWISYLATFLTVLFVLTLRGRLVEAWRTVRRAQWWWFAVGLGGIPIVISMSWAIPLVGVAICSICSVAGQTLMSLILDHFGVGIAQRIPLGLHRLLAALIALAGLALAVSAGSANTSLSLLILVGFSVFGSGCALVIQSAGNGAVTELTGDPLFATFISVIGGAVGKSLILLLSLPLHRADVSALPHTWWLYLGGVFGAGITFCAAWAVRHVGTFSLTLAVVTGQMAMSLVMDYLTGTPVSTRALISACVMVGATFLVAAPCKKASRIRK